MAHDDKRYVPVAGALPLMLPPVTRLEATRAAQRLYRHFGGIEHGSVDMVRPAQWRAPYRSKRGALPSWCSTVATYSTNHDKGWGALIHEVSHDIHAQRCPRLRPHDGAHSKLEAEVAAYVVAKGWLDRSLLPKAKPKPTAPERRVAQLAKLDKRLAKWNTKYARACTAIKKLSKQRRRLEIIVAKDSL